MPDSVERFSPHILPKKEFHMKCMIPRPGQHAGHVVHEASYENRDFFYKENKPGKADLTLLEKLFSIMAKLGLNAHLTPDYYLVEDEGKIAGLAVENLKHVIARREGREGAYYYLEKTESGDILPSLEFAKERRVAEIPFYFFSALPENCFANLLEKEKAGLLQIDRGSLASILTTAYTYEEDDLHKSNWGVYFTEANECPKAVFFKIDHDLLFVASIKASMQRRLTHLLETNSAFKIDVESLENLPKVSSHNDYWPAKKSYFTNLLDKKNYSATEVHAFSSLKQDEAFEKEKWLAFYKQILLPNAHIYDNLRQVREEMKPLAGESDAVTHATVTLVYQATLTRLAHLRAALFASEKFRHFLLALTEEEKIDLIREITPEESPYWEEIKESLVKNEQFCRQELGGDSPLHTAIRLKAYRFEESLHMYGQFLHVKNHQNQTPLDVAIALYESEGALAEDMRLNMGCVIRHLLDNGAKTTLPLPEINAFINPYLAKLETTTSYALLKNELIHLSEDNRFSLKSRKNLAIDCVKRWLELRKEHVDFKQELMQFKKELNGHCSKEEAAGLKFLLQLRSNLWIVRQIRGLYGRTSTQTRLNKMLDNALKPFTLSASMFSRSFFCGGRKEKLPEAEFEPLLPPGPA